MVIHEQKEDISFDVQSLLNTLFVRGYKNHYIHVGPLIRREKPYSFFLREERRSLFNLLFHFLRRLPIQYIDVVMDKRSLNEQTSLVYTSVLTKKIAEELKAHYAYFSGFDKIIVYYDYGQSELAKILVSVFCTLFSNVEFRKAYPTDYILLQVADLICTVEMIEDKQIMSRSEEVFFHSKRDFYKNIIKTIRKKRMK